MGQAHCRAARVCIHAGILTSGIASDALAIETDWDASLRGRIGHLVTPNFLAYVTGGANLQARGGYPLTIGVGLLFAAAAVLGQLRLRLSEPARGLRVAADLGIDIGVRFP